MRYLDQVRGTADSSPRRANFSGSDVIPFPIENTTGWAQTLRPLKVVNIVGINFLITCLFPLHLPLEFAALRSMRNNLPQQFLLLGE